MAGRAHIGTSGYVYADYFNNDRHAHAVRNARRLAELVLRRPAHARHAA